MSSSEEEFEYRNPIDPGIVEPPVISRVDEGNINTLKQVQKDLENDIAALYKDFNAFDVMKDGTNEEVMETMMRQIAGRQIAFDILTPVFDRIKSAVDKIEMRR